MKINLLSRLQGERRRSKRWGSETEPNSISRPESLENCTYERTRWLFHGDGIRFSKPSTPANPARLIAIHHFSPPSL